MKPTARILLFFATVFAFSCTDSSEMLTVIHPDGSCYRAFTARADSTFMLGDTTDKANPFPVTIDSSYTITWKYRNNEPSTTFPLSRSIIDSLESDEHSKPQRPYNVVARKDYESVEEMAATFHLKPSHEWNNMKVTYAFEKKFSWFYTDFIYRETYPTIETHFSIPIEEYMSADEARFWFTGQPSMIQGMNGIEMRQFVGDLEDKYNKWFGQNIWNDQYTVLLDHYDQIVSPPVTRERLELLRDTLFNAEVKNYEDFDMEKILNNYFNTNVFSVLWETDDSPMNVFEKDFEEQPYLTYLFKSFTYRLVMPGKITQANNAIIRGDTLVWKLTAERMLYCDYVLEAHSRKTNLWAYILTGLVLVVALGSFIYKPRRKKV